MAIVIDLDGTVSDSAHREHLIEVGWDEFHAASVHDEPIVAIKEMLLSLHSMDFEFIVAITGRPAKWRSHTMQWLLRHLIPVDELLMRPDLDFRPAPEVKRDLITEYFGGDMDKVSFVLEDSTPNVEMFRSLGLTVLQVHHSSGKATK